MIYLLGGVAILCGLLLLLYLFVNANPAKLARGLKWIGIDFAVLAVLALAVSGRLALVLAPFAVLMPVLRRLFSTMAGMRGPAPGRSSEVETAWLRMTLDHDTGAMTGTVLRGQFAGMRLEELSQADVVALLRQCRTEDEESARLLEAYLDRLHPDWHNDLGAERAGTATAPSGADMTIEEAYAVLGLAPGVDAEAIRSAHRRLMKQLHPDHGGTDYFATKLNRARDLLLNQ